MRSRRGFPLLAALLLLPGAAPGAPGGGDLPTVTVGSKAFPESWILGEAVRVLMASTGTVRAEHRSNLGGTEIVYAALRAGSLDVYPEYTGTIAEVLMKAPPGTGLPALRAFLAEQGLAMTDPLGFNDGYALAARPEMQKRGLEKISDLARFPDLRLGFTDELIGRKDGWEGLAARYRLTHRNVRGLQHELAYEAIGSGQIDLMDIYTTDAHIARLGLKLLEDDLGFFPRYEAVLLYR